jgi:tRNA A37 N6-isopentenylltransferase MiaA
MYNCANAQKVAEEIYNISDNPTARDILEMARDAKTETHKLFEWDDTMAAEKYRIVQARRIVRNLEITQVTLSDKTERKFEQPIRLMYHLRGDKQGYRPTSVIIENEDMHKHLLRTAYSELLSYINKYQVLTEIEPLIKEIERYIYELKVVEESA